MGSDKKSDEVRSKFSPTGNEQGSSAVQPDGHRENNDVGAGAREQLEREEQRGGPKSSEQDDSTLNDRQDRGNDDAPGLFSALVGDGKEP